jgi:glycerol kinase
MKDWVLVIDQGGQSTRVAVFDSNGKIIVQEKSPCATQIIDIDDHQQHIEQNPQEILGGITDSLEKIQLQLGNQVSNIKAAGFSGQGSSLLCWNNKTGEPLSPVLSWQDTRGKVYLDNIKMTHQQVQQFTGLRFSPHYGASKIRWCLDNLESVKLAQQNNQLTIGPIVSFILWHLAGRKNSVDPGHAQRTLLWNIQSANWDLQLLQIFSIPQSVLPECYLHQDNFGKIFLGHHSVDFCVCARDQGASLFANTMPDKNTAYINIGTGAFIQRISQNKTPPEGLLISPLWISQNSDDNLYAWEATVNGSAAAIPFIEQESGLKITPDIIEQALSISLGTEDYFINTQGGLGAPFWRTDIESRFSGLLSPLQQVAVWLESILFLLTINLQRMNPDNSLTKIQLSGGFSQSDKFCQLLADLMRLPVSVNENPEASLQGIAYLTANRPDLWNSLISNQLFTPVVQEGLLHKRFASWYLEMQKLLDV